MNTNISVSFSQAFTDGQKQLVKDCEIAIPVVIAYAAAEVPALGNLTPQGLVDELGRVNAVRKALEKTEAILKQRIVAISEGEREIVGDHFSFNRTATSTTRLDQTAAKKALEKFGALEECMTVAEGDRITLKRL